MRKTHFSPIFGSSLAGPHDLTMTLGVLPDATRAEPAAAQPLPLALCALSGAFGGGVADSAMHSLDTVKTRQQGAPHVVAYRNMVPAFVTIGRTEGVLRGLYGGYLAALAGLIPLTGIFFFTYEEVKRHMLQVGINESLLYLVAGFTGDLAALFWYVPSEVLKTRLQLQGRHNNPHFRLGYNYRGLVDAARTIVRTEGAATLFYGYKHTLARDLPFSAIQFAFYEQFRKLALQRQPGSDGELSVVAELTTGAAAGGLSGTITTPLDVIKTRVQTQTPGAAALVPAAGSAIQTHSVVRGLVQIARHEGLAGLFSGVGPRFVWTSIQLLLMLFLYQVSLRHLEAWHVHSAI